jgi:hypothetical protein
MARTATKGKGIAVRANVAEIEQQLALQTESIKQGIGKPSGRKISVKNKQFTLPDGAVLGPEINVIVVDFITMHRFYKGVYNPNNIQPPVCFAMGQDIQSLAPPSTAPEIQNDICQTCPQNQFGSSLTGKGKACKNTREIAVILHEDAADDNPPLYTISVSPTSIKSYDAAVAKLVRMGSHPIKAVMTVSVNGETEYANLIFEVTGTNEHLAEAWERRAEALDLLMVEPDLSNYQAPQPARGRAPATPVRNRNVR